jgi:hypothetical protein
VTHQPAVFDFFFVFDFLTCADAVAQLIVAICRCVCGHGDCDGSMTMEQSRTDFSAQRRIWSKRPSSSSLLSCARRWREEETKGKCKEGRYGRAKRAASWPELDNQSDYALIVLHPAVAELIFFILIGNPPHGRRRKNKLVRQPTRLLFFAGQETSTGMLFYFPW